MNWGRGGKVASVCGTRKTYDAATPARHDEHGESGGAYGVSLGIPEYQVDFSYQLIVKDNQTC